MFGFFKKLFGPRINHYKFGDGTLQEEIEAAFSHYTKEGIIEGYSNVRVEPMGPLANKISFTVKQNGKNQDYDLIETLMMESARKR